MLDVNGNKIVREPTPRQQWANECPAFELLFGGAKGGGKSEWLVICILALLRLAHEKWLATGQLQSNCRIFIFRKNLNDLKDILVKQRAIYPLIDPEMGVEGFKEKEKYWRFTSGATVEMHHLDDPTSHLAFNGQEITALLIDEVQFISWEAYSFLLAQVRNSDPDYNANLMIRLTANPGGPHGDWVKDRFVTPCPAGGKIIKEEIKLPDGRTKIATRAFVRSFISDNPYVDPDGMYQARLRTTMSPEEIRQYLEGDFDVVSGAFFSHLLKPVHFQQSRPLPDNFEMLFSIDWGSTAPACCHIGMLDPASNRLYIVDELHTPGITGKAFGEKMKDLWRFQKWCVTAKHLVDDFYGVIDTQAMDRYGSEGTAAEGIMSHRFRLYPAQKSPGERRTGINQIKERLILDRSGNPQIIIFEDRCPNLKRALQSIMADPLDLEDYHMRSPQAHAIDALRFICMQWAVQPQVAVDTVDADVARWNEMIRKANLVPQTNRVSGGYS